MRKRIEYLSNDQEYSNEGAQNDNTDDGVDNMNLGIAGAVAAGNTMQTGAHSLGLLFEQSTTQQNNQFQLAMTNTVSDFTSLLAQNINLKGTSLIMKNELFEVLESMR